MCLRYTTAGSPGPQRVKRMPERRLFLFGENFNLNGIEHEGSFFREKNLRQVQDHPSQRQSVGDLCRQSQAQTAPGISFLIGFKS
jgi:hypothetical protein